MKRGDLVWIVQLNALGIVLAPAAPNDNSIFIVAYEMSVPGRIDFRIFNSSELAALGESRELEALRALL